MKYSFTVEDPIEATVESAKKRVKVRRELAHALGGESRPLRQYAASVLLEVANEDPAQVVEFEPEILDALSRPEPMTVYQALRIVDKLVGVDARVVDRTFDVIEACLHEESATVRLSAFRTLAHYGGTTPTRSERVWPPLADAIRCYHGDNEFPPMLSALTDMLGAKASDQVKTEAAWLFEFDVENSDDFLARKAAQIVDFAKDVPGFVPGAWRDITGLPHPDEEDDE